MKKKTCRNNKKKNWQKIGFWVSIMWISLLLSDETVFYWAQTQHRRKRWKRVRERKRNWSRHMVKPRDCDAIVFLFLFWMFDKLHKRPCVVWTHRQLVIINSLIYRSVGQFLWSMTRLWIFLDSLRLISADISWKSFIW